MRDRHTGHPRGFGFVTFADEDAATAAASRRHDLDGRQVEAKRAVPRSEGSSASAAGHSASFTATPRGQRYNDGATQGPPHRAHHTTKCKVFVGGLPSGCGGEEFRNYFSQFGEVVDAQVMIDHNTGNSRGFGFVTFASEATVNAVVGPGKSNTDHEIMGKCVEVKRAEPKGASQDRRHNRDSYNQGGGRAGGGASQNEALPHSGANGRGANAAAAAAAAYYSNYPASLAEQYGAYYNNPQWQQYYAAMGYNFNFPQSYNPYQQYLQAYMNTQASANGAGGSAGMPANAASPNAPGTGGKLSFVLLLARERICLDFDEERKICLLLSVTNSLGCLLSRAVVCVCSTCFPLFSKRCLRKVISLFADQFSNTNQGVTVSVCLAAFFGACARVLRLSCGKYEGMIQVALRSGRDDGDGLGARARAIPRCAGAMQLERQVERSRVTRAQSQRKPQTGEERDDGELNGAAHVRDVRRTLVHHVCQQAGAHTPGGGAYREQRREHVVEKPVARHRREQREEQRERDTAGERETREKTRARQKGGQGGRQSGRDAFAPPDGEQHALGVAQAGIAQVRVGVDVEAPGVEMREQQRGDDGDGGERERTRRETRGVQRESGRRRRRTHRARAAGGRWGGGGGGGAMARAGAAAGIARL
ncbi:Heterogeneous nuclear ribonucleoprotein [Gracilaria domingensis]|nr:Heterogeneous nuclear ribonucleoprotein [Gracilaria domingensis]